MVTTAKCDSLMPGFKKCVEQCNDADGKRVDFVPFSVEGKTVGYMLPSFTAQLADFGDVFKVIFIYPTIKRIEILVVDMQYSACASSWLG